MNNVAHLQVSKKSETRKMARMFTSLRGKLELVWMSISFRREERIQLTLQRLTCPFWAVELLGKCTIAICIFQFLGKSIASAIFQQS